MIRPIGTYIPSTSIGIHVQLEYQAHPGNDLQQFAKPAAGMRANDDPAAVKFS